MHAFFGICDRWPTEGGVPDGRPFKEAAALALFSMAEGNALNRQAILELTAGGVVPLAEQLSKFEEQMENRARLHDPSASFLQLLMACGQSLASLATSNPSRPSS